MRAAESQVMARLAVLVEPAAWGELGSRAWGESDALDAPGSGGPGEPESDVQLAPESEAKGEPEAGARDSPGPDASADSATDGFGGFRARAITSAMRAYTAAHGHPLGADELTDRGANRWGMRTRVAAVGAVALLLLGAVVVLRAVQQTPSVVVPADGASTSAPVAVQPEVVVHVVGQVLRPGVVRLPDGSRVVDAIEAAGGAGPEADLAAVNLARVLLDGEQVVVPRPGEQPVTGGQAVGASTLDLNAADAATLDTLPGIGPVLAQRIIDWRTEHGGFTVVDELAEVSGIGPSLLSGVRDLVRVG